MSTLSPDVEKGFKLESNTIDNEGEHDRRARQRADGLPSSDKQHSRGISRLSLHSTPPDTSPAADNSTTRMGADGRLRARAFNSWLQQQSGYLFLLVVFLVFLRAGLHAAAPASSLTSIPASSSSSSSSKSIASKAKSWLSGGSMKHPIPSLMDAADARYRAKLSRQSRTLSEAVAEYKRRYGRAPPRGFDQWYAFAVEHGFVMIDEFDGVEEDLKPFWTLSGEELRLRASLVGALPSIDLVRVESGKARTVNMAKGFEDSEVSGRANGLKSMMSKFVAELPDMDFPVNAKAEGRVVVPWEHVAYPNLTADPLQSASHLLSAANFKADWAGAGSVWDAWRRTCSPESPARRLYSSIGAGWSGGQAGKDRLAEAYYRMFGRDGVQGILNWAGESSAADRGSGFEFMEGTNAKFDFCTAPGAHFEQGHFFSDWRTIAALAPVFSPARARGFGDIRIPSHYYYGGTRQYTYAWDPINLEQRVIDPMEVPWEKKRDAVWWRGASTGGGNSPEGFGNGFQRHRFIQMSSVGYVPGNRVDSERSTEVTFALPPLKVPVKDSTSKQAGYTYEAPESEWTTATATLSELNVDIMDAAFVKTIVPTGKEHRFGNSVELGVSWGYKYLLDMDGMGYSGRFMAFMASDSVPVKVTVYDEYFSDWIEPWVHFIPLSSTYSEIYNIVSYFSGPPPAALKAANVSSELKWNGAPAVLSDRGVQDEDTLTFNTSKSEVEHRIGASDPRLSPPVGKNPILRRAAVERREDLPQLLAPIPKSAAQEEGDRRLRRIARAGKQWKQTVGRTIDMEVYVYRLALEYGRLWADDREAMSYRG